MKKNSNSNLFLLWSTQMFSALGSSMTSYALILWVYSKTQSAFNISLLSFCSYLPYIIGSIFFGPIIDKYNKKNLMLISDFIAALGSLMIFILNNENILNVWPIFIVNIIIGLMNALSAPAQSVIMGLLAPNKNYEKISGLLSFSSSIATAFTPMLATSINVAIGLNGILAIDLITFIVAFLTLLIFIYIPEIKKKEPTFTFFRDSKVGYYFLKEHNGIFYLVLSMCAMNFFSNLTYENILPAMILGRSGSQEVLGIVSGTIGLGGILGGLIVVFFQLPKNKIKFLYFSAGLSFLLGDLFMAFGNSIWFWIPAALAASIPIPFTASAQNYILYNNVPEEIQGRVFSTRNAIQYSTIPIGILMGGWLSDYVFEPLKNGSSPISFILRYAFGSTKGSGMAAMFFITGILGTITCIIAYNNKNIRSL